MNLGRLPIVEPMGSVIRVAAIVMSGIVLLGFAFFAVDEMNRGSQNQQNALDSELQGKIDDPSPIAPSPKEESLREKRNSGFREVVDDAGDVLLAPFGDLVDSDNTWVNHGVPTILALLLYGLGLGMLANVFPKGREHAADWRTA